MYPQNVGIFPFFNIINMGRIYFGGPRKSNIVIIKAHDPYPFILLPCGYDNKSVRFRVRVRVKVRVRLKVMVTQNKQKQKNYFK
jgi:hypothetical protein